MIKVNQKLKSLIQTNISNLNDLIEKYYEGSSNSRYKSWEWCHLKFINAFNKIKNKEILDSEKESLIDDLSLNLGFYLASYGMYRGSCFSLRCDYKIYKSIVKVILDEKYDILWNYDPSSDKEYKAKELLFNKEDGVIQRIKDAYLDIDESFKASNTLITKILLITDCNSVLYFFLILGLFPFFKFSYKNFNESPKVAISYIMHPIDHISHSKSYVFDSLISGAV